MGRRLQCQLHWSCSILGLGALPAPPLFHPLGRLRAGTRLPPTLSASPTMPITCRMNTGRTRMLSQLESGQSRHQAVIVDPTCRRAENVEEAR